MAVETELKLHIAPENMERLKRHPLLKMLASGRAVTRKMHNIYYDTPKMDLYKHAMALRLRHAGGKWLQTLKGGGSVEAGLHSRNEWEIPVAGEALDLAALQASGGRLPQGVWEKLQAVFTTDFTRNERQLNYKGAVVELCMDSGEIRAGTKTCPISELEFELKSGEPQQLFNLALDLLDIVPLQVEYSSKAEYGYRLCSGSKLEATRAQPPRLERTQGIGSALRNIISACLQHVQANVQGAIQNLDEEYLHQVRVGLRRLRVALAMAQTYRPDDPLDALHKQVSELCVELGRAREWDVFVTQTLAPIRAKLPENAGLRELMRASEKIRKQHHAKMQASLASQDFQRLLLHLGHWMQSADLPGEPAEGGVNLAELAAQTLEKHSKQVHQRGKQLAAGKRGEVDPAHIPALMHALRIACKKLRYSAEMFESLFETAKTSRYLTALTPLQDIMGFLNDIAVARRLMDEIDNEKRHKTYPLIFGWMEHDYAMQSTELKKAWKRFEGQDTFWS